jgi:hypothetical protein
LIAAIVGLQGLVTTDTAWAKPKKEPVQEKAQKSYVLPYAIVVLGVALGMILVLRPVRRENEPKRNVREDQ